MSSVAVVGVGGALGRRIADQLGARAVDLRCSNPCDERRVPELADADVVVNAGGPRVRPGLRWGDYSASTWESPPPSFNPCVLERDSFI
jgi:hypothetical protein